MSKSTPKKEPEFKEEATEAAKEEAEVAVVSAEKVIDLPTLAEAREEAAAVKATPKVKTSKVIEAEDTGEEVSTEVEASTVEEVKAEAEVIDNIIGQKLLGKGKKLPKVIKV